MSDQASSLNRVRERGEKAAETSFAKDLLEKLSNMSREEIDNLPFGLVKVNDLGVISIYNKFESNFAGVPIEEAENKNFFTQVAPCTNNNVFYGTFKHGVSNDKMNYLFYYTFTYKMKPTIVKTHLYRDPSSKDNYILVEPQSV